MDDERLDEAFSRPDPERTRRMLAEQLRNIASLTVLTTAGDETLARAAALVQTAADALRASTRSSRYDGVSGLAPASPANDAIWETHAAFGRSNPLAPPVEAEERPGHLTARVTFGGAWEGGPGSVYGGFIAAVMDGMLGRAVISAGHLGVTRSLTIRYLRPTPLHTPLRVESTSGDLVGRNVTVSGRMWAGDTLTCEAEAVFTCVDADRYRM